MLFRSLYKHEIDQIPILARAFRLGGFIPIDRRHKEAAMRSIEAGTADAMPTATVPAMRVRRIGEWVRDTDRLPHWPWGRKVKSRRSPTQPTARGRGPDDPGRDAGYAPPRGFHIETDTISSMEPDPMQGSRMSWTRPFSRE